MSIIKCKMCGGDVNVSADKTFGTCEYCGCAMTFPKVDDEQRAAAFNRGNYFRRIGEFDKALLVYEKIVEEDNTDAEAHWCCALCRFGIEYVEDPTTFEWLPTCHRASFDSFTEDVDYLAALEYSDGITKRQYQKDGAKIAEVQKRIISTSQNEAPFDVFICYKETDENGQRTVDSTIAQDIYYQLTEQGRRVFFARITLEDKVGTEYEPYIFAALNSAKVMICVGTKPEHFNAVWVKNEWNRFLALMKKDRSKILLPCYRDMDAYDLPEALSVLQSYDMSKIGFIQDLLRGVAKVLDFEKKPEPIKETVVVHNETNANQTALMKRGFLALEDGEWTKADDFFEQVLNLDAECAEAYLGKLMAETKTKTKENLKNCAEPFDNSGNYQKTIRFGDKSLADELKGYISFIKERNENARLENIYNRAVFEMESAKTESGFIGALNKFKSIPGYRDSAEHAEKCVELAEIARKDAIYNNANTLMKNDIISDYVSAIKLFESIPDWKDSNERVNICKQKIDLLRARAEADRLEKKHKAEAEQLENERKAELACIEAKRKKTRERKNVLIGLGISALIIVTAAMIPIISISISNDEETIGYSNDNGYTTFENNVQNKNTSDQSKKSNLDWEPHDYTPNDNCFTYYRIEKNGTTHYRYVLDVDKDENILSGRRDYYKNEWSQFEGGRISGYHLNEETIAWSSSAKKSGEFTRSSESFSFEINGDILTIVALGEDSLNLAGTYKQAQPE